MSCDGTRGPPGEVMGIVRRVLAGRALPPRRSAAPRACASRCMPTPATPRWPERLAAQHRQPLPPTSSYPGCHFFPRLRRLSAKSALQGHAGGERPCVECPQSTRAWTPTAQPAWSTWMSSRRRSSAFWLAQERPRPRSPRLTPSLQSPSGSSPLCGPIAIVIGEDARAVSWG